MMDTLAPTLRTLGYLRPMQIAGLIRARLMAPVWRTAAYDRLFLPTDSAATLGWFPPASWPGDPENGRRILGGIIRLIGRDLPFAAPVDWRAESEPLLVRFTLHYFEWLADLADLGGEAREPARRLVADWIDRHPRPEGLGWHPYPLSLRVWSWLAQGPFLMDGADETFRTAFTRSLDRQGRHLRRCVESAIGGNHLIKNLKALIALGQCLSGHATAGAAALGTLKAAVERQVLADGGHEERSPHYHAQVLADLIDLRDLLAATDGSPDWLTEAIPRMADAFAFFRLGDGGLALFNDGTTGEPHLLTAIEERLGGLGQPPSALPDSGYDRLAAGETCLLMDTGWCCPDDLPAHAHADMLSFELSVGAQRLIVNSGTYAYQDPLWRNRLRATAAHSTVEVDGLDSAEVYGVFRLGRRPRRVEARRFQAPNGPCVEARHDGYRHLGLSHFRRLTLDADGHALTGEDRIEPTGGRPMAKQATAHFHLHPDVEPSQDSDGSIRLVLPNGGTWLFEAAGSTARIEAGTYAPRFHDMRETRQIVLRQPLDAGNAAFSWLLRYLS